MILVDSSVLVSWLRGDQGSAAQRFDDVLARGIPIVIEPHVLQEVLQGARDQKEWATLERYLRTQPRIELKEGVESHIAAARIFYDCRRRGLTVRSIVDCLVAQTAIEHDLPLLAQDRDYDAIAQVRPLRFW